MVACGAVTHKARTSRSFSETGVSKQSTPRTTTPGTAGTTQHTRYWWPFLGNDLAWYVRTCHICQTRQTRQIQYHRSSQHLHPSLQNVHGYHAPPALHCFAFIVQGQCSLTNYPEFRALERNCTSHQRLDLPRHTVPMGHTHRNPLGQRQTLRCSAQVPRQEVSHQAHLNQQLQLTRQRNS